MPNLEIASGKTKIEKVKSKTRVKSESLMTWTVLAVVEDSRLGSSTIVELGHGLTKVEAENTAKSTGRITNLKLPGAWKAKIVTVPTKAYHNFFSNVCIKLRDMKVTDLEEAPPAKMIMNNE